MTRSNPLLCEECLALARQIQNSDPVTWTMVVQIPAQTEKHAAELADFLKRETDIRSSAR